jgi:hypothetical protein
MSVTRKTTKKKSAKAKSKNDQPKRCAILFFDVKGYSQLEDDTELKHFHEKILPGMYDAAVSKGRTAENFLYMNSWGDGIVLISEDYMMMAATALDIRDYFRDNAYAHKSEVLRKKILKARISLHWGELHPVYDPFQGRDGHYGREIILSARMEPITPPNRIWVTDRMKDEIEGRYTSKGELPEFSCLSRGKKDLAKQYGSKEMFELVRIGEPSQPDPDGEAEEVEAAETESGEGTDPVVCVERIKTLIPSLTEQKELNLCYKTGLPCELPAPAACLTAELVRNSEIMSESREFLVHCSSLHDACVLIDESWDDLKKANEDEVDSKFDVLQSSVKRVFTFFADLVRDYSVQDDWIKKHGVELGPMMRMEEFLKRRLPHDLSASTDLKDALVDINQKLNSCLKGNGTFEVKKILADKSLHKAIWNFHTIFAQKIKARVNDVAQTRLLGGKSGVVDGFEGAADGLQPHHFVRSVNNQPHRNGGPANRLADIFREV